MVENSKPDFGPDGPKLLSDGKANLSQAKLTELRALTGAGRERRVGPSRKPERIGK